MIVLVTLPNAGEDRNKSSVFTKYELYSLKSGCKLKSALFPTTCLRVALLYMFYLPKIFPGGSGGKESACNPGDPGSTPGLGRSPGEGNGNSLQYSWLENSMDRGACGHFAKCPESAFFI